jgi:hypothetical protein
MPNISPGISSHAPPSGHSVGGMFQPGPIYPIIPKELAGRLISPAYFHEMFNHPAGDDFITAPHTQPGPQPDGPWNMRALAIMADRMTPDNMFVIYGNPRDPFTPDF